MVPEKTVRAVLDRAAELNGGAPLGENAAPLAVTAIRRALAFCQRTDVPEGMEQAVAALLLVLWESAPRNSGGESAGGSEKNASRALPSMSWEALAASGAVKSIQRGDTAVTFQSGGGTVVSGAPSGTGLTAGAALEGLKPWRRLGRLKGGV